jgi:phospholipid/cholesterol/gamma-HCH transport system permease protein
MRNLAPTVKVETPATLRTQDQGRVFRIVAAGDWVIAEAPRLDTELKALRTGDARDVEIDGSAIEQLDSAGTWLLMRTKRSLEQAGRHVTKFAVPERYAPLVETMDKQHTAPPVVPHRPRHLLQGYLERIGRATVHFMRQGYDLVGFLGRVSVETAEAVVAPRRELPLPAFFHQLEETGLTALPIVGMLAFLLGVVLAYQGADQLKRFGAQIYTIDFLGVGFLRELGGLVTAIIIAGRSG